MSSIFKWIRSVAFLLFIINLAFSYILCPNGRGACDDDRICCPRGNGYYMCCPDTLRCCESGINCCKYQTDVVNFLSEDSSYSGTSPLTPSKEGSLSYLSN